jgi:putative MATE family efflux protein
MKNGNKYLLTEGNIKNTIIKMTIPMIFGMMGLVIFNLVDTFYISKLGNTQLAALAFTYPVVLFINSINLGIGLGASTVVAHAVGRKDTKIVQRLGTDAIFLSLLLALFFTTVGLFTVDPLFTLLGADGETLVYIKKYMNIWYLGNVFVIFPMVGNNIIRALGDTKTPSIVMLVAAIGNMILDPIFIFGLGPIPALGISGAAIATVISRALTFSVALYVLLIREKVIIFRKVQFSKILNSWKQILYIGVPNSLTRVIIPVATGVITGLIAGYGIEAVAGYGVATKLEFFLLVIFISLSAVMGPFVGQNYGAKKLARIKESMWISEKFVIIYGISIYVLLFFTAPFIAGLFNDNQQVIDYIVLYLRIVPLAYGFQGIFLIISTSLSSIKKPFVAAGLSLLQMIVLYIPMAILGSRLFGITGIFGALVTSYFISGIISHFTFKVIINKPSNLL